MLFFLFKTLHSILSFYIFYLSTNLCFKSFIIKHQYFNKSQIIYFNKNNLLILLFIFLNYNSELKLN